MGYCSIPRSTSEWERILQAPKARSCECRRHKAAIAEGKKPLTTRGSEERPNFKLPQRGLGRNPRNQRDFEHFTPKRSTFWALQNLTFFNNQIKKIVPKFFDLRKTFDHKFTL